MFDRLWDWAESHKHLGRVLAGSTIVMAIAVLFGIGGLVDAYGQSVYEYLWGIGVLRVGALVFLYVAGFLVVTYLIGYFLLKDPIPPDDHALPERKEK